MPEKEQPEASAVGPTLTTEIQAPGAAPMPQAPITPMVHQPAPAQTAMAAASQGEVPAATISYREIRLLGDELAATGFLPDYIKTGAQAAAIILAGRELGIPPMKALRSIKLVKGQVVLNADLQLGMFKSRGGRAQFRELSDERAVLDMVHPNGDTHTEVFTMLDADRAGLLKPTRNGEPSNYIKFPRPMLRSRCITGGLKSIGFEELAGAYDPEEAKHFDGSNAFAFVEEDERTTTSAGNGSSGSRPADRKKDETERFQVRGVWLDEKYTADAPEKAGRYKISDRRLGELEDWALLQAEEANDEHEKKRFLKLKAGIIAEQARRKSEMAEAGLALEDEPAKAPADGIDATEHEPQPNSGDESEGDDRPPNPTPAAATESATEPPQSTIATTSKASRSSTTGEQSTTGNIPKSQRTKSTTKDDAPGVGT